MKKKPNMTVSQKIADLNAAKKKKAKAKGNFFLEMKEEMKKVSWTSKDELKTCGKIVIGSIFVLGIGIYLVDLLIRSSLDGIGNLVRLIGA
ncbi:MAG: preprotein translocase subunit SecE [Chlamydiales bacterium]|nr:preprotein translocase subunit SecE [Chlamydiia bacterium]MCP5504263.1 preprotein translocase subunit SecE [Chlamydiales bacterium]